MTAFPTFIVGKTTVASARAARLALNSRRSASYGRQEGALQRVNVLLFVTFSPKLILALLFLCPDLFLDSYGVYHLFWIRV
jgi:hypothetical protein